MTSDLVEGFLTYLDEEDHGEYITEEGEVYTAGSVALANGRLPAEPHQVIGVTFYNPELNPNPAEGSWVIHLQVRGRGAAGEPDSQTADRMDRVRNSLHGLHHATLGSVKVARVAFTFGGPIGPDANGCQEYTDNYRVVLQ